MLNLNTSEMKAVIESGKTYKITGERGDFYICENEYGKVKMFVKSEVVIIEAPEFKAIRKVKSNKTSQKLRITANVEGGFESMFSNQAEKEAWLKKREDAKRSSI